MRRGRPREGILDYRANPFLDMLGNPIREGDCVAFPENHTYNRIRLNICVCEGYDKKGIILRMLNRDTGRWKRHFPRRNSNYIRIAMEDKTIEEVSEVSSLVGEVRERHEEQRGKKITAAWAKGDK